ncbi:hypothetical protein ACP70R_034192 [Stipagrostis hirtigluma subsp. patula]
MHFNFQDLPLCSGNKPAGRTPLDWETSKIAPAAARRTAYLHAEACRKFIHGNIKSSNIVISQELSALCLRVCSCPAHGQDSCAPTIYWTPCTCGS